MSGKQFSQINFQKPIDKQGKIVYNKDTEREVDNYGKQNLLRRIVQ
jgi:hypothetical protein